MYLQPDNAEGKKKFITSSLNIKLISKVITKILHNLKITFIKL